ncbi:MAG: hypothetical protein MUF34_09240 [Polyangiaceae bacterium]|jgi:hypothetical protein|nr:hypothetical protein [Polyangiaceae bacterium]
MKARTVGVTVALLMSLSRSGRATPAHEPSAAYDAFEEGRQLFSERHFEAAAERFELANRLAPTAAALANAIRAQAASRRPARAAALAVRAGVLYPELPAVVALVRKTLQEANAQTQRLDIECNPECQLEVDGALVEPSDSAWLVLFLEPGRHQLRARWGEERRVLLEVDAEAGKRRALRFELPRDPPPAAAFLPVPPKPPSRSLAPTRSSPTKPWSPWVVVAGGATTVFLGSMTLLSYADAKVSPGTERVRAECAGASASCPAYRQGEAKELRTNVLLVSTASLAALTAGAAFMLIDWPHRPAPPNPVATAAARWTPYAAPTREGAMLGLVKVF